MLKTFAIIDYINDDCYTYTKDEEIEWGFQLDMIFDRYDRYGLNYKVERYNEGKVYVIYLISQCD